MSESTRRSTRTLVAVIAVVATLIGLASFISASLAGSESPDSPRAMPGPPLEVQVDTEFDGQFTIALLTIRHPSHPAEWHYLWTVPTAIGIGNLSDDSSRMLAVFASTGQQQAGVVALNLANSVMAQGRGDVKITRALPPSLSALRNSGQWRTLSAAGKLLVLDAPIRSVKGGTLADFPPLGRAGRFYIHQALKGGYFQVETTDGQQCNVFVSPLPSYHVDRADRNWYLTQFNTETTSNCGPTATAMVINWAKGINISVIDIRKIVGWEGDGAVSLEQLKRVCDLEGVDARLEDLRKPADIFDKLARNQLLIVSYNMVGVSPVADPVHNLLGQYYYDEGGHYLALKGFSLDRQWVIVYDPIPSDWAANALRYPDGVSMLGRNRYYSIDELWRALNSRRALVVAAD